MIPACNSLSDPARLMALHRLNLLDSEPEAGFDRITRLARQFLDAPVALVSLVDDKRQFFKAASGLGGAAGEARQTPLTHSFCQHVVITGQPLVVTNSILVGILRIQPSPPVEAMLAMAPPSLIIGRTSSVR